ncbi:MAG: hypothetical protein BVN35_15360 [Proteobacteria bacterium ST_bin11]|nr:MAG: hypothetical protein BVN35_15360 [Proteobacteria bacterium ST_bin11]
MNFMKKMHIGWKVSTLNLKLASLRYRVLIPVLALKEHEIESRIIYRLNSSSLTGLDALIIVKSFTLEDYYLAHEAVKIGVPVIFDLCDNIFIGEYKGKHSLSPSEIFLQISNIASAIVVSTDPLALIVKKKISRDIPIYVVPDGIETAEIVEKAKRLLTVPQIIEGFCRFLIQLKRPVEQVGVKFSFFNTASPIGILQGLLKELVSFTKRAFCIAKRYLYWRFWMKLSYSYYDRNLRKLLTGVPSKLNPKDLSEITVEKHLSLSPSSSKIVWFGSHGADHANFGMLDLLIIREELEKLACELPLELIVVSNNFSKFKQYISPMSIPTRYVEWTADSMTEYLQKADVVVIPNSLDEFSICKSANRTVLALSNNVPVVATSTPALLDLKDCIVLNDFENGLRRYLNDSGFAQQHVQKGQELIGELFGLQTIGKLWNAVIDNTISTSSLNNNSLKPELIFLVHLPQDIEILPPLLTSACKLGVQCSIWGSLEAVRRWPSLGNWIKNQKTDWRILPNNMKGVDVNVFPKSACAVFSATETNLNPHRFTHSLVKLANDAGLYTATVQHGFENVGISYTDHVHAIERIRIASNHIYIWGSLETLHKDIPVATRQKCISVGCPKPETVEKILIGGWDGRPKPLIGIFENLHWHRYSEEYRQFFIESVVRIAELFPEVDFFIKPHNAGLWLTSRYQG